MHLSIINPEDFGAICQALLNFEVLKHTQNKTKQNKTKQNQKRKEKKPHK
jgi:hypothetical protein